jgi:uncharacterized membrane protein YraQ (UPF0718 family)
MSVARSDHPNRTVPPLLRNVPLGTALLLVVVWQPVAALETVRFVLAGLIHTAPIVIPGIALAAWIMASGANNRVRGIFRGRTGRSVIVAALVGAMLPVCGVTVLPLMAGLLAGGVPLAPVMAFWLASPITGPAMVSATIATLGWQYALGKTLAAIGLGLFGGFATAFLAKAGWAVDPLRSNRLVGALGGGCTDDSGDGFAPAIWRDKSRRRAFISQFVSIARLILIVLTPAFAAEFWLNVWLKPDALTAYVGAESALAVPLAVLVGAPAYVDGYAALPLTRALLEHGMSSAAAMAFLVSGGVVSIWGAMAIAPVLRLQPFALYLVLAATGSMAAGWIFGLFH